MSIFQCMMWHCVRTSSLHWSSFYCVMWIIHQINQRYPVLEWWNVYTTLLIKILSVQMQKHIRKGVVKYSTWYCDCDYHCCHFHYIQSPVWFIRRTIYKESICQRKYMERILRKCDMFLVLGFSFYYGSFCVYHYARCRLECGC